MDIKPFKIIVKSKQSEFIQKRLFENNYSWQGFPKNKINHTHYKCLYFNGNKLSCSKEFDTYFESKDLPEISFEEFVSWFPKDNKFAIKITKKNSTLINKFIHSECINYIGYKTNWCVTEDNYCDDVYYFHYPQNYDYIHSSNYVYNGYEEISFDEFMKIYEYKKNKNKVVSPKKFCVYTQNLDIHNWFEKKLKRTVASPDKKVYYHYPEIKSWVCTSQEKYEEMGYILLSEEEFKNMYMKDQKEIIGYDFKDETSKQYESAAAKICGCINDRLGRIHDDYIFKPHSSNYESLKEAGVLEVWFKPVYVNDLKIRYFGDVKFTIHQDNDYASTNYGKVTKEEIKKAIDYIEYPPKLAGHSLNIHIGNVRSELKDIRLLKNDISLSFGCKKGTYEELVKIYKTFK